MYAREIEDRELTFGVSGKLIRNVLVMYDRQTNSLWSQLLGESVEGELVGAKLEFLPSWMMTWEEWKELHPDTIALDKGGRVGGRDAYDNYYDSPRAGVIGQSNLDDRLYIKEFVIGVEAGEVAVAYPFSVLNDEPVVNDSVGDHELLVVFDPETAVGVVFNRQLDGQTLTFSTDDDLQTLTDEETASSWDPFNGEALSGPLAGAKLERMKSTTVFWFGWADFFPETDVYGLE